MEYSERVCDEVVGFLEQIPRSEYDKLPRQIINYFYQNCSPTSENGFVYNTALPVSKQNLHQETKDVLTFLIRVFLEYEDKSE
jgi:hypothetical protein